MSNSSWSQNCPWLILHAWEGINKVEDKPRSESGEILGTSGRDPNVSRSNPVKCWWSLTILPSLIWGVLYRFLQNDGRFSPQLSWTSPGPSVTSGQISLPSRRSRSTVPKRNPDTENVCELIRGVTPFSTEKLSYWLLFFLIVHSSRTHSPTSEKVWQPLMTQVASFTRR